MLIWKTFSYTEQRRFKTMFSINIDEQEARALLEQAINQRRRVSA